MNRMNRMNITIRIVRWFWEPFAVELRPPVDDAAARERAEWQAFQP